MTQELKPCPFCGADAVLTEHEPHDHSPGLVALTGIPAKHPGSWTVECVACSCGMIHGAREEAIAAWNRRAPVIADTAPVFRCNDCESFNIEQVPETMKEVIADTAGAWQIGTPPTKAGDYAEYIVAVRRKAVPDRVFVFSSNHANNYGADDLRDQDGNEYIADGWYTVGHDTSGEFDSLFMPMLEDGDEVLGWQPLPKWDASPAIDAAGANNTVEKAKPRNLKIAHDDDDAAGASSDDVRDQLYFALVGAESQLRQISKLMAGGHEFIDKGRTVEIWADMAKAAIAKDLE